MALKISERYTNASPPDSDFTEGSVKNDNIAGDKTGTPVDKDWLNDYVGWTSALRAFVGGVASGLIDTATNSDRLNWLRMLIGLQATARSIDALRTLNSSLFTDGDIVHISGFSETWEVKTGVAGYDDNWRCIFNDDPNRYAECTSSTVNPKIFGAYGTDLNDDTAAFAVCTERAKILQREVVVPQGVYIVNELELSNLTRMRGVGSRRQDEGWNGVTFRATTGTYCLKCFDSRAGRGVEGYAIENIKVVGSDTTERGIILIGTDALVRDVIVDNVPNGVGMEIGWSWRSQFDAIKITNCGVGLLLANDGPINAITMTNLCIELCTVGMYAPGSGTQSVANVFNGVIIEGCGLSVDRSFPSFLAVNQYAVSDLGMTAETISGAFYCEQEFHAVFNGWYSEAVEGPHLFTGYYCNLQFNSPYFQIETYGGVDIVLNYPMICAHLSPLTMTNGKFYHKNLNDNDPFISLNPAHPHVFEGCHRQGTNATREFFTYIKDNSQDNKFYDNEWTTGTYCTDTGITIKRGSTHQGNLDTSARVAGFTNYDDYALINVGALHGISFTINNNVDKHYTLTGCDEPNKTLEISMTNSHSTDSIGFYLYSDITTDNLGTLFTATVPALTVRTLKVVNLGNTWVVLSAGDSSITI